MTPSPRLETQQVSFPNLLEKPVPHRFAGRAQSKKSFGAFSEDIGNGGVPRVAVAVVEVGPLEDGEVCEDLQEKFVWKLEYWEIEKCCESRDLRTGVQFSYLGLIGFPVQREWIARRPRFLPQARRPTDEAADSSSAGGIVLESAISSRAWAISSWLWI